MQGKMYVLTLQWRHEMCFVSVMYFLDFECAVLFLRSQEV